MTEVQGSTGGAVREREDEGAPGTSPNKGLQQKPRLEEEAQVTEQVVKNLTFAQVDE